MATYPTSSPSAISDGHAFGNSYGPVGTVPTGPGVSYFGENFQSRNGPTIMIVVGTFGVVLGLGLLAVTMIGAVISLLIGGFFLLIGLRLLNRMVHRDIVCDLKGIIERHGTRKAPTPPLALEWHAITTTECDEYTVTSSTGGENAGETTSTYHRLILRAANGAVMTIDDVNVKGLTELITLTGQYTPHLPYRWMLSKEAKGMPVQVDAGKYSRVTR